MLPKCRSVESALGGQSPDEASPHSALPLHVSRGKSGLLSRESKSGPSGRNAREASADASPLLQALAQVHSPSLPQIQVYAQALKYSHPPVTQSTVTRPAAFPPLHPTPLAPLGGDWPSFTPVVVSEQQPELFLGTYALAMVPNTYAFACF